MDYKDVNIRYRTSYKSPSGALDYSGTSFQRFAIELAGRSVGELDVQIGREEVTVRNVLLYQDDDTGRGIGRAVYARLCEQFPNKVLRSSFNQNRAPSGRQTQGLSPQAIHMWEALLRDGLAEKRSTQICDRFYFVLTSDADGVFASLYRRSQFAPPDDEPESGLAPRC